MLLENNLETLLLHFDKGLGSTDETPENNKDIMARLESPSMNWSWVIYEGEFDGDDMLFFGRVNGFESELGYFTWGELKQIPDLYIKTSFSEPAEAVA
jgi:hypothetical protein